MVTKNQIKLIKSLSQKKFRNKHGLFVVEGLKGVREFVRSSILVESIYSLGEDFDVDQNKLISIDETALKKLSFLKTPQEVLGVFRIPTYKLKAKGLTLVLDGVRDPGNLGTIIRMCDWFGIENLVCSDDTVDCYNPKVVQASMGSLSRVKIFYQDIRKFILNQRDIPVYNAMLDGKNVNGQKLPSQAVLVMGNEANGISSDISALLDHKLNIPQFGKNQQAESLNVATATAILLNEFRRNFSIEK